MKGLDPKVEQDGLDIGILPDVADIHVIRNAKQAVSDADVTRLTRQDVPMETSKDPILHTNWRWIDEGYTPSKEDRKTLNSEGLSYANNLQLLKTIEGCVFYTNPGSETSVLCLPPSLHDQAYLACLAHLLNSHMGLNATLTKTSKCGGCEWATYIIPRLKPTTIRRVEFIRMVNLKPNVIKAGVNFYKILKFLTLTSFR